MLMAFVAAGVRLYMAPTPAPEDSSDKITLKSMVWAIHFAYDNFGFQSFERIKAVRFFFPSEICLSFRPTLILAVPRREFKK
jgi:hypothetical protein